MHLILRSTAPALIVISSLCAQGPAGKQHIARQEWAAAKAAFDRAIETNPADADSHIGLGVALWGLGERASALAAFERAVKISPQSAEAHFNVGIALRGLDQVDAARQAFENAVRLKADHERARLALGLLLQHGGELEAAAKHYREILRHNPGSAEAHNWLGVLLLQKNDAPEAISAFRHAVRLQPDYVRAWNNLGSALAQTGSVDQAVEAFEAGLKHAPADAQLLVNYGMALRNNGDAEKALKQFRAVAENNGATADLHFQIAQTLRQSGDLAGAIASLSAALEENPELSEAYYALGAALKQQAASNRPKGSAFAPKSAVHPFLQTAQEHIAGGDFSTASKLLADIVATAPNDVEALVLLGYVQGRLGRLDDAIAQIRRALEVKPSFADAHYQLGVALWYKGEYAESRAALDEAVRLNPASGEAYAFRGMTRRHSGDFKGAREDLQFAIGLAPTLPAPYIDLGMVLLKRGRTEHAVGQFEAALNLPGRPARLPDVELAISELRAVGSTNSATAELYSVLGRLLGSAGAEPNEVLQAFQEAVRRKPDYSEAWNHLGLVHVQLNDDPKAIAAFREALKLRPDFADAYSNLGAVLTASNPAEAIRALEQAVRLAPNFVKAHYNLALAYGASADHGPDREIEELRKVIALEPRFARAYFALGRALLRKNDANAAIAALEQALRLEPGYGEAHYQLGLALSRAGRKEDAVAAIQKGRDLVAADQRQKSATLDLNEGRAALDAGDLNTAVAKFSQAVRSQPSAAEAHHYLGLALAKRGDTEAASVAFRKTLELNPAHATAKLNLDSLQASKRIVSPKDHLQREEIERYIRESRFKEVEPLLQKLLQERPNWAWGWYALGYASFAQQRLGDSIKALAKSLELEVTNAEAHNLLGRNLMMVGRFDAAQTEFEQAARFNPTMAEARYNLGQLFSIQDNWAEARRALEEAVRIKPDYAEAHNALGFALEALGIDEAALASYRKAIELIEASLSSNPAPYVNVSAYYNKSQQPDAALEYARKAIATNAKSDRAWFQAARAHERQGEQNAAADALSKAIAINPRVATYYYVLATVYRRLGRLEESRSAMERFRQLDRESNDLERKRREALRADGTMQ